MCASIGLMLKSRAQRGVSKQKATLSFETGAYAPSSG